MRDGSFAVDLIVYDSGLVQAALDTLAGRDATAIVNLAELVGITFGGFKLVRWLARRKIRSQEALSSGMVRITFDDGQTITIPSDSLRLAADKPFREAARDVVAPVDLKVVQKRLGHSSIALTADTYTHVLPELHAEAAEMVARLLGAAGAALADGEGLDTTGVASFTRLRRVRKRDDAADP